MPTGPAPAEAGDELYAAMDWLGDRQSAIEQRLAKRHLKEGGLALFDLTSTSFEDVTCPLPRLEAGARLQPRRKTRHIAKPAPAKAGVNWGLLTSDLGCPVGVSVFAGNTADPKTLLPQVEKVRNEFGIDSITMVGDRGMISNIQIEAMRQMQGVEWITALKSGALPATSSITVLCNWTCSTTRT